MKQRLAVALLAVAGLALACGTPGSATSAPVKNISGNYSVTGTNLSGSQYDGDATITKGSDSDYTIEWHIAGETQNGSGTFDGTKFETDWQQGEYTGAATYTLQSSGALVGTWTQDGESGSGSETLTPN
jgi:hypothetical protein